MLSGFFLRHEGGAGWQAFAVESIRNKMKACSDGQRVLRRNYGR